MPPLQKPRKAALLLINSEAARISSPAGGRAMLSAGRRLPRTRFLLRTKPRSNKGTIGLQVSDGA
jgi:hypothetical protein